MAVCIPCALKHNMTGRIPQGSKFHNIIGWKGICNKCNEVTMVYSNQDMGVNPEIKDVPKL